MITNHCTHLTIHNHNYRIERTATQHLLATAATLRPNAMTERKLPSTMPSSPCSLPPRPTAFVTASPPFYGSSWEAAASTTTSRYIDAGVPVPQAPRSLGAKSSACAGSTGRPSPLSPRIPISQSFRCFGKRVSPYRRRAAVTTSISLWLWTDRGNDNEGPVPSP